MAAAVPDRAHAGSEVEWVRERLRRAGLLDEEGIDPPPEPDPDSVARARVAVGRGTTLAQLVIDGRGPR